MKEEKLNIEFVEKNGESSIITLEPTNTVSLKNNVYQKLGNKPYKLQNPYQYKKYKKKGIFTSDIGIKSKGFAPIFTLALIIAFGGIIIAYLLWRF